MADATAKKSATTRSAAKKTPAKRSSATKSSATKSSAKKSTTKQAAEKNSPAKTSSAKKSPPKKSPAKKSPATDSAAEKSTPRAPAKKAAAKAEPPPRRSQRQDQRGGSGVASTAREVVRDLTGKEPESVTGMDRQEDGWVVEVEVLELQRIPTTTDVLATYQVELDGDGELKGYRRVERYLRGSPGGDRS